LKMMKLGRPKEIVDDSDGGDDDEEEQKSFHGS